MVIVKSEFALALNQVAAERGISSEEVIKSIEMAVSAAFTKDHPQEAGDNIEVKINKDTGETRIFKDGKDITPPGFGRIAAQTAKQIILQKIREAEKKNIVKHYQSQVGAIIRGRVIRFDGQNAYFDIGKTEAVLPKEEQIRSERYLPNSTFILYLKNIVEDKFSNPKIVVSRIDPELIRKLFEREVPEIANGAVEIKKVVREPGERAKIAVFSAQTGIDPVGASVGQKGVRVQTVTSELGGNEKIDIIQWHPDDRLFITAALSPASIIQVEIDKEKKKAKVTVEESQAPLAIGKSGINVNLAGKLTGHEIDILQIPSPSSEKKSTVAEKEKKEEGKAKSV